jgi:hypothetical protein
VRRILVAAAVTSAVAFVVLALVPLRNAVSASEPTPPLVFGGVLLAGAVGSILVAIALRADKRDRRWLLVPALPLLAVGFAAASQYFTT